MYGCSASNDVPAVGDSVRRAFFVAASHDFARQSLVHHYRGAA
jgi:hypothetical protein